MFGMCKIIIIIVLKPRMSDPAMLSSYCLGKVGGDFPRTDSYL